MTNKSHHKNLYNFCLIEITFRVKIVVRINIDKYVIKPTNDNGILSWLFSYKVPHGLFKTVSQPLIPIQESEFKNPKLFKVIEPVSTIPIVLRIRIIIFGHLESFSFLFLRAFNAINFFKVCYLQNLF